MVIEAVTRKYKVHVTVFCKDPADPHMLWRCAKEDSHCLYLWYSGSGSDAYFDWIKPNSENVMGVHIGACAQGILWCMEGGGPSKSSGPSSGSIYTPICRHTTCELRGKIVKQIILMTWAPGNFSSTACIWIEAKYEKKLDARYTNREGATNSTIKQIIGVSQDQKLEEPAHQIRRASCTGTRRHLGVVVTPGGGRRGKRGPERVWTAHSRTFVSTYSRREPRGGYGYAKQYDARSINNRGEQTVGRQCSPLPWHSETVDGFDVDSSKNNDCDEPFVPQFKCFFRR